MALCKRVPISKRKGGSINEFAEGDNKVKEEESAMKLNGEIQKLLELSLCLSACIQDAAVSSRNLVICETISGSILEQDLSLAVFATKSSLRVVI